MSVVNDKSCSWINDLNKRSNIKILSNDETCDWLIVGAGYTGLSAARKLSELHPNEKIIIVDAQLAGEGASGRNSGYLVDTTLNDGFSSNKKLLNYIFTENVWLIRECPMKQTGFHLVNSLFRFIKLFLDICMYLDFLKTTFGFKVLLFFISTNFLCLLVIYSFVFPVTFYFTIHLLLPDIQTLYSIICLRLL